jgi:hypothetical protein
MTTLEDGCRKRITIGPAATISPRRRRSAEVTAREAGISSTEASLFPAGTRVADLRLHALGHSRPSLVKTYRPEFPIAKVRAALDGLSKHWQEHLGTGRWMTDPAERQLAAKSDWCYSGKRKEPEYEYPEPEPDEDS